MSLERHFLSGGTPGGSGTEFGADAEGTGFDEAAAEATGFTTTSATAASAAASGCSTAASEDASTAASTAPAAGAELELQLSHPVTSVATAAKTIIDNSFILIFSLI